MMVETEPPSEHDALADRARTTDNVHWTVTPPLARQTSIFKHFQLNIRAFSDDVARRHLLHVIPNIF